MSDFFGFSSFGDFFLDGEKRWSAIKDMSLALVRNKGDEPNVDPLKRSSLEELSHIAQLKIAEVLKQDLRNVKIVPVTRQEFVTDTVESYKQFLEVLEVLTSDGMEIEISGDLPSEMLSQMPDSESSGPDMSSFMPMLIVFVIATGIGNLGLEAMSSYELIAPRTTEKNEILLVMKNIEDFTEEWSLNEEDFLMWMCLAQLSLHAVISIPHIQSELTSLIEQFTSSFEPSTGESLQRLGDGLEGEMFEMEEQSSMNFLESKLMSLVSNEPEILLGAQISEVQETISEQLSSVVAVIRGVSQFLLDQTTKTMFGSNAGIRSIKESILRKQSASRHAINMISRLLGIDMSAELRDLGTSFVYGIVERGGDPALALLLDSVENLPTPAELGNPNLWLARVGLTFEDN